MPPPEVVFALQNPGACNFGTTLVSPIHVAMPSVRLIAHLLLDNPQSPAPTKTDTTEEDGVEQISDSCDDEYEFIPTQTSFKIAHWTARALVTVAIGHSEELVLSH